MNEITTKIRTVYSDKIKTENDIFKRNVTSKEERERGGGRREGSNMQFWLSSAARRVVGVHCRSRKG